MHRAKDTTHKTLRLCIMRVRGPTNVGRAVQTDPTLLHHLRRSRIKRNFGSCWLKGLTGFKLCATARNNMQQGVQTDATCNIQQCWELLPNNIASVCTGLYTGCPYYATLQV